jgi:hypothetical protein
MKGQRLFLRHVPYSYILLNIAQHYSQIVEMERKIIVYDGKYLVVRAHTKFKIGSSVTEVVRCNAIRLLYP